MWECANSLVIIKPFIMNNDAINKNPVLKLSFESSLSIVSFCEILQQKKKFVLARQLSRSGASIGENVIEAQNAESKTDFIHKFKIAAK